MSACPCLHLCTLRNCTNNHESPSGPHKRRPQFNPDSQKGSPQEISKCLVPGLVCPFLTIQRARIANKASPQLRSVGFSSASSPTRTRRACSSTAWRSEQLRTRLGESSRHHACIITLLTPPAAKTPSSRWQGSLGSRSLTSGPTRRLGMFGSSYVACAELEFEAELKLAHYLEGDLPRPHRCRTTRTPASPHWHGA